VAPETTPLAFGTTHRLLYLILGLQLFTIIGSWGNMAILGEGLCLRCRLELLSSWPRRWLSSRFKKHTRREYKVPFKHSCRSV